MADPVLDNQIIDWQPDAATNDTNLPQGSSLMTPGGPTELAGELRVIKSVTREVSVDLAWERWAGLYGTLTFIDTTHFTLSGDQRTVYQGTTTPADPGPVEVGRRVRCTVTAGYIYGTISNATFSGGVTNVTVAMDSTLLDSSLSEVAFGTETVGNTGLPAGTGNSPLYGIATGTNTYAVAISVSAYQTGQEYRVLFTNANTGPSTLNINSLGPVPIVKAGSVALAAGDMPAGAVQELVYDGTNMQLIASSSSSATPVIPMGTSGSGATPIGTASIQIGNVTTPANTSEVTLYTYTLPANALVSDGQYILLEAWGTFANDANAKTVRLRWGGTVIGIYQWPNGSVPSEIRGWFAYAKIVRTGAAAQVSDAIILVSSTNGTNINSHSVPFTALTASLTSTVAITVTGQNGSAVAAEIDGRGLRVMYGS
jgi:hypothetical protein